MVAPCWRLLHHYKSTVNYITTSYKNVSDSTYDFSYITDMILCTTNEITLISKHYRRNKAQKSANKKT